MNFVVRTTRKSDSTSMKIDATLDAAWKLSGEGKASFSDAIKSSKDQSFDSTEV